MNVAVRTYSGETVYNFDSSVSLEELTKFYGHLYGTGQILGVRIVESAINKELVHYGAVTVNH